jgi:high-affinity Fe2+/Pb2+ permease
MNLTTNKLKIYLVIFAIHVAITVYVVFQSLASESYNYALGLIQGVIISGSWVITLKWFHENVFRELNKLIALTEIENQ